MQQTYKRKAMPKCYFNKFALQLYWNRTLAWVFPCKFAVCFQNTFSWEHHWTTASNLSKRKILMNAFFDSQFKYCPLISMCHSRSNKSKINRLDERWLRIIYNGKQSSFKELFEKDSSISIHEKNVQILATEMYNIRNNFSSLYMNETFEVWNKHSYNLRQNSQFFRPLVKSVYHGTESIF